MRLILSLLVLVPTLGSTAAWVFGHEAGAPNILASQDWDCEQPVSTSWRDHGGTVTPDSDSFTGSQSYRVTGRRSRDQGARIRVTGMTPGNMYYFSIYVKQLNNRTENRFSAFRAMGAYAGGLKPIGILPWSRADGRWKQVGGDFICPEGVTQMDFYVRGEPEDAEYLFDTAALTDIPEITDLKAVTDPMIDADKKTEITITGTIDAGTKIEATLVRHEFGHGVAIKAPRFNSDASYRSFVKKYFNWAVFENDMKIKKMEARKGRIKFGPTDKALTVLLAEGFVMRGHLMLWNILETFPNWMKNLRGTSLWNAIVRRVTYMAKHYKGKIAEWDMMNEELHGHFVEARSGHLDAVQEIFNLLHQHDPTSRACFNDYQLIRDGMLTSAVTDLAKMVDHVGCIGLEGHLRRPVRPERLLKRMDVLASAGLPITISEFSVHNTNGNLRAKYTEEALRTFMAHPMVHAVMWWGPTDVVSTFATDQFTFTGGSAYTPTKAGEAMIHLFNHEWLTKEQVDSGVPFRGFRGKYKVVYTSNGQQHEKFFTTSTTGSSTFTI